jgi:hypothetical protein
MRREAIRLAAPAGNAGAAEPRTHDENGRMPESWTIRNFAQSNPKGEGQGDVPELLRRVARSIEELGDVSVQDITFGTEITEDGPWQHLTVYFHYRGDSEPRQLRGV